MALEDFFVIRIVNASGVTQAQYAYNAWGKLIGYTSTPITSINLLRYRGYYYDAETGFYYLQSRYYDPSIGRFINADSFASTGQGFLGYNMFAYCLNNPVNHIDISGTSAAVLEWWIGGMGWLPLSDAGLPVGDIIYIGGIVLLGLAASEQKTDNVPDLVRVEATVSYNPQPPDGDDDDGNYGGRQRVGKSKGKTPRNNQSQNKQFRDLTKRLNKAQKRILHEEITGKGLGFHEIQSLIEELFPFVVAFLIFDK